ncbi:MAG: cytochrome c oxidase assembly factor CtaG, partial [Anoxybacillus ayderensis]|nr:cytochrome c oxidase assembly factor CtaG [Anoxybacillus ayderensis]
MMPLSIFGFEAMWSPYFFIFLVAVTIAYFWLVNRAKEQTTTKQKTLFVTAIVLLYICKGSPVDLLGHLM